MQHQIYARNKYKYYCLNPYGQMPNNCERNDILGKYASNSDCAMDCYNYKSLLWDLMIELHIKYNPQYGKQVYIDTFIKLRKFVTVIQKLAKKNNVSLIEQLITSYNTRKYTYHCDNNDIIAELIKNDNLINLNTQCTGLALLCFLFLDIAKEPIENYRLVCVRSHVDIQVRGSDGNFVTIPFVTNFVSKATNENVIPESHDESLSPKNEHPKESSGINEEKSSTKSVAKLLKDQPKAENEEDEEKASDESIAELRAELLKDRPTPEIEDEKKLTTNELVEIENDKMLVYVAESIYDAFVVYVSQFIITYKLSSFVLLSTYLKYNIEKNVTMKFFVGRRISSDIFKLSTEEAFALIFKFWEISKNDPLQYNFPFLQSAKYLYTRNFISDETYYAMSD